MYLLSCLGNPRNLVVAPNGIIYVTRREEADVVALRDTNRDGRADSMNIVAKSFKYVNGITINKNRLYLLYGLLVQVVSVG